MVSLEFASLFTKVPLKVALQHISHLLSSDNMLIKRTNFPAKAVCERTELWLRATYFDEQFYRRRGFLSAYFEISAYVHPHVHVCTRKLAHVI